MTYRGSIILRTIKKYFALFLQSTLVFDSVLFIVHRLFFFSSLLAPRREIINSYEKMNIYSCQSYEWDRITFADYTAALHGPANSWVLLFR